MRFSGVRKFSNIATNPWNLGVDYRGIVGPMTVIVTKDDVHSKQLAQKMWFTLQTQGIQSTFITMKTLYPVVNEVKEASQLFTRAGSKSIITIGDASVTDFGKLMRKILQSKSFVDQIFENHSNFPQKVKFPHLSVMSTASIHHFLPNSLIVHKEEDILQGVTAESPSVSIFDEAQESPRPYLTTSLLQANTIASLFDYLFTLHYLNQSKKVSNEDFKKLLDLPSFKIADLSSPIAIARYAQSLATSRVNLAKIFDIRSDFWPGMIEIATNLTVTDGDFPFTLPFTYHQLKALEFLMRNDSLKEEAFSQHDVNRVLPAINLAGASLMQVTGLSKEQLHALLDQSQQDIVKLQEKNKTNFRKPGFSASSTPMMPEGNIEKISILLDAEQEAIGSLPFAGEQKKLLLDSDLVAKLHETLRETETWKFLVK